MKPITNTIVVQAPIEVVWDTLADVESHESWMTDAESIEFLSETRSGAGTRIVVRTRVGPLRSDDTMEFVAWEPPTRMTVVHVGAVRGEGEFTLSPVSGGTKVTWTERFRFPWFLAGPIGAWLARPILGRIFAANLRRFGETVPRDRPVDG